MRELRKEYDRKLSEMDKHLRKSIAREQEDIDEEELDIGPLRERLNMARGKISGAIKERRRCSDGPPVASGWRRSRDRGRHRRAPGNPGS